MSFVYYKDLKTNSQRLRKEMTKEERHLWYDFLKNLPFAIKRQKVIGKYIVDFYCPKKKTVIEIDGSQHFTECGIQKDAERDAYLNSLGIEVLRCANDEVNLHFESVCNDIIYKFDLR